MIETGKQIEQQERRFLQYRLAVARLRPESIQKTVIIKGIYHRMDNQHV